MSMYICQGTLHTVAAVIICYLHIRFIQGQLAGSIIPTPLYCEHDASYYEVGQTWEDNCNRYNCTDIGIYTIPKQTCTLPTVEEEGVNCPGQSIQETDEPGCCTHQVFCSRLPPHKGTVREPPSQYKCPDGWSEVNTEVEEEGERIPVAVTTCVKLFTKPKAYEEAKQSCRSQGAFLVNLDIRELNHRMFDSAYINQPLSDNFTERLFWTGLHDDGRVYAWDGGERRTPEFKYYCRESPETPEIPTEGVWGCNYFEQWNNLTGRPCVAAETISIIPVISPSNGDIPPGERKEKNISQLVLDDCSEEHQYICATVIVELQSFSMQTYKSLCGEGWYWNAWTGICVSYMQSRVAKPDYFSAADHCLSMGGTLYNPNTKEKEFLLYDIMRQRNKMPQSVWVHGTGKCTAILNPYLLDIDHLKDTRAVGDCYSVKPYFCEKLPASKDRNEFSATLHAAPDTREGFTCILETGSDALTLPANTYYIGPYGEVTRIPEISRPIAAYIAGPYFCAVWSEILRDYVYSDVVVLDDGGSKYPVVINIPLKNETTNERHSILQFYPLEARELELTERVLNITMEALIQTKKIITDLDNCQGCTNAYVNERTQLTFQKINSVRPMPEDEGLLVSTSLVFGVDDVIEGEGSPRPERPGNWSVLDHYYVESLKRVLELSSADDQSVQITNPGKCIREVRYIESISSSIILPTANVFETFTTSLCGYTGKPVVTATCGKYADGARWIITSVEPCEEEEDVTDTTRNLRNISLISTDSSNVVPLLEETSELITEELNAADVTYVSIILHNAKDTIVTENDTNKFFEAFTRSVNRVLDVKEDVFAKAQTIANASSRIVDALEKLALTRFDFYAEPNKSIFQTAQRNLAFKLTLEDEISGVILLDNEIRNDTISYSNASRTEDIINQDKVVGLLLRQVGLRGVRKSFIVYGNNKLHKSNETLLSVNTIVSATIATRDGEPIKIRNSFDDFVSLHYPLTTSESGNASDIECGFWRLDTSTWATDGCNATLDGKNGILCTCNHLTDFSILLDINRDETEPERVEYQVLSIISQIGLAVSIAALGLVILTAVMYRRFRKTNSQKVLTLLALCLFGLNLTFIIGMERTETYIGCVTVAVLIHYFLLCSFAWMFVEAILQYMRFVKVLGTYIPRFMIKTSIPAFGIPAVAVAINLAIDVDLYKASDKYCWMKREAILYSVLIPIGIVLIANMIVFGLVCHGLVCARRRMKKHLANNASEQKNGLLHLRAGIAVFIVLGLTWVFGYLALIEQSSIVFQYLFCIFNSIQGLLIFIFHNIREPAVRREWKKLCCCEEGKSKTSSTGTMSTAAKRRYQETNIFTNSSTVSRRSSSAIISNDLYVHDLTDLHSIHG